MRRRTFVKSIGALPFVHLLKPRDETQLLREHLNKFTGDEYAYRYDLGKPFCLNSRAYATDGRAIARIETTEDDCDPEKIRLPKRVDLLFDEYISDSRRGHWRPFELNLIPKGNNQTGYCYCQHECPRCRGEAWLCVEGDIVDCPDCDFDGQKHDKACENCHGKGSGTDVPCQQRLGDVIIHASFARILSTIPGVEVNSPRIQGNRLNKRSRVPEYRGKEMPIAVTFRSPIGIQGAVAPLNSSPVRSWLSLNSRNIEFVQIFADRRRAQLKDDARDENQNRNEL